MQMHIMSNVTLATCKHHDVVEKARLHCFAYHGFCSFNRSLCAACSPVNNRLYRLLRNLTKRSGAVYTRIQILTARGALFALVTELIFLFSSNLMDRFSVETTSSANNPYIFLPDCSSIMPGSTGQRMEKPQQARHHPSLCLIQIFSEVLF